MVLQDDKRGKEYGSLFPIMVKDPRRKSTPLAMPGMTFCDGSRLGKQNEIIAKVDDYNALWQTIYSVHKVYIDPGKNVEGVGKYFMDPSTLDRYFEESTDTNPPRLVAEIP